MEGPPAGCCTLLCGDALEGKGPRRRPRRRLGRQLEAVAEAVGGRYCRLQMPLRLALDVRGTGAGHRLGPWGGVAGTHTSPYRGHLPPFQSIPALLLQASRGGARAVIEDSPFFPFFFRTSPKNRPLVPPLGSGFGLGRELGPRVGGWC